MCTGQSCHKLQLCLASCLACLFPLFCLKLVLAPSRVSPPREEKVTSRPRRNAQSQNPNKKGSPHRKKEDEPQVGEGSRTPSARRQARPWPKSRPRRKANETNPRNEGPSQPGEGRPTPKKGGQPQVQKKRPSKIRHKKGGPTPTKRAIPKYKKKNPTSTQRKNPNSNPKGTTKKKTRNVLGHWFCVSRNGVFCS